MKVSATHEIRVYDNYKLNHNGIVRYTTFENVSRKMHRNSMNNLLNYSENEEDDSLFRPILNKECEVKQQKKDRKRHISSAQSKRIRSYCSKLSYYSQKRIFTTSKSKKYSMKVAFLTLTAPADTTHEQFCHAFDLFLDYLRRTANCIYVWKKEIGENGNKLHVHIMINNFIPYYIVSWKWKRLLISQGVIWQKNNKGQDTNSHTRIELPHNSRQAGAYISKYMSKGFEADGDVGYLWGKSKELDKCKEYVLSEGDVYTDELRNIGKVSKIINHDYVSIVICDLLKVRDIAPHIYEIFNDQYIRFSTDLTLPQRFHYIE